MFFDFNSHKFAWARKIIQPPSKATDILMKIQWHISHFFPPYLKWLTGIKLGTGERACNQSSLCVIVLLLSIYLYSWWSWVMVNDQKIFNFVNIHFTVSKMKKYFSVLNSQSNAKSCSGREIANKMFTHLK